MSHEAKERDLHEAPAPPTSTRWSEDPVSDEDTLAPPFVPGRPLRGPAVDAGAESPPASGADAVTEAAETPPAVEPATAQDLGSAGLDEEPFPFETLEEAPERDERPEQPAAGVAEEDFPFDRFDIEGEGERTGREDAETAGRQEGREPEREPEPEPEDMGVGWSPADLDLDQVAPGEAGGTPGEDRAAPEAGAEAVTAPEPEAAADRETETPADREGERSAANAATAGVGMAAPEREPVEEAAALLERLSGLLRTEGEEAVRREMESPDRMTALLAGLLAGYVSGRS